MSSTKEPRHAWITGASSGLGRALALRMVRDGWIVSASSRSAADLASLAEEAKGLSGRIEQQPLDITDPDDVRRAVQELESANGPLEQAVLNAGTHWPTPAPEFDAADARKLIDVNLIGTMNCFEAALTAMQSRGRGRIALVASVAGIFGLPTAAVYTASKAGLIGFAQSMKPELDALGITLQLVNPGFVRTPLTDKNDFAMPFLMEVDEAADAFYAGLKDDRFEIVFPRRMAWSMRVLRTLPHRLSFALTRRMLEKRHDAS